MMARRRSASRALVCSCASRRRSKLNTPVFHARGVLCGWSLLPISCCCLRIRRTRARRTKQSRDIRKQNVSFFQRAGAGSIHPGDQHVVPAVLADWFRGEAPADFCTVDDIEIHRCTFVFQLLQTTELLTSACQTTHSIGGKHSWSPALVDADG